MKQSIHDLYFPLILLPLMNQGLDQAKPIGLMDCFPLEGFQIQPLLWVGKEKQWGLSDDTHYAGELFEKCPLRRSCAHWRLLLRWTHHCLSCYKCSWFSALHVNRLSCALDRSSWQHGTKQKLPADKTQNHHVRIWTCLVLGSWTGCEACLLTWKLDDPWETSSQRRYSCITQSVLSPKGARPR